MNNLPSGTVTFLFTDIEGSTQLWEQHPESMKAALAQHDAILRGAVESNGGHIIKTTGDGAHAVFATAIEAINAVIAAHHQLREPLSGLQLKVRMGLHTGEAEVRDGDYYGQALNRAARLMVAGHGGQVLLSAVTADLVRDQLRNGVALLDLGQHRLKDLVRPEQVYQVVVSDLPSQFPPLKSLDSFPNNLPVQLTSFVGREREIADIQRLLAATHLLTLIGPGGTGKTRLSLQIAAEVLPDFANGAWLIELAPLADATHLLPTIASAFNLRELPGRPLPVVITDYLRDKSLLLLLDNCEHLIDACARLADDLLHACPRLKIIASSREALGIAGEAVYRIPPLSLPDVKQTDQDFARSEAVQLFAERAAAAQAHFRLDEKNVRGVAQICQRLDGVPLAIELAAARVRVFSVDQIAARLDDRFRLLVGGSRTALPRQQTLRALIDWSYDLLPEDERKLLRFLSVFAGGWTFEAAEAVGAGADVLNLLTQLVNKSLVMVDDGGSEMRYRFLETIRQYARDKLFEAGEAAEARDRHFSFYAEFGEQVWVKVRSPEATAWRDRLEAEADNIRTALEWGLVHHAEEALLLAANVMAFWGFLGFGVEGRRWMTEGLARVRALPPAEGSAADRRHWILAKGFWADGTLAMGLGEVALASKILSEAVTYSRASGDKLLLGQSLGQWAVAAAMVGAGGVWEAAQESVSVLREVGDKWALGMTLVLLARMEGFRGNLDRRHEYVHEALRLMKEAQSPFQTGMVIMTLAFDAKLRGENESARQHFEESLILFRQQRNRQFEIVVLSELAHITRQSGDYAGALTIYRQTLLKWRDLGHQAAIAQQCECFAFIARAQNQPSRAVWLLGAAEALREALGSPMTNQERSEYEREVVALRAQMDQVTFGSAWAAGRELTMEQAIDYAMTNGK